MCKKLNIEGHSKRCARCLKCRSFDFIFVFLFNFLVEHWGERCDEGRRQSPVDLATEASVHGIFPSFTFADYDEPIKDAAVVNTGHSSKLS